MTFREQDAVLRGYAKRHGFRLHKRRCFPAWGVYRIWRRPAWRISHGDYQQLLRFFEGVEEGRNQV